MNTRDIQSALIALGYSVGPTGADGIMGRNTIAGIRAFQKDHPPLVVDGIVGPQTTAALNAAARPGSPVLSGPPVPPWVTEAARYLGLDENRDAKRLDSLLNLNTRATPWCGGFAGFVIAATLPQEPLPGNVLWALNWASFGRQDVATTAAPHYGAVAVFKRNGGGHVGLTVGHDATYVHVLGGNQSNKVSVTRVSKKQLVAYRWPATAATMGSPLATSVFAGTIFDNRA